MKEPRDGVGAWRVTSRHRLSSRVHQPHRTRAMLSVSPSSLSLRATLRHSPPTRDSQIPLPSPAQDTDGEDKGLRNKPGRKHVGHSER